MEINKIRNIIDNIYFSNIADYNKNKIRNYAPYILQSDNIGIDLINDYMNAKKKENFFIIIISLYVIYYIFFLIILPFFYLDITNAEVLKIIDIITFDLTKKFSEITWYSELAFHVVGIFISLIAIIILFEYKPSTYKYKNRVKDYIMELLNNNQLTKKNISKIEKSDNINQKTTHSKSSNVTISNEKHVFIVHGHKNSMKFETARFVENIGLKSIILHEQNTGGRTIIEKIEKFTNVAYAIVLLSSDDKGYPANSPNELKSRARQNVIFEHGYLMAKLGRHKVCALLEDDVEIPSDLSGIVYIPYDKEGGWKMKIFKEMKNINLKVDISGIL